VAIVSAGDVQSAAVRHRVGQVARQLRTQPDVASAVSFYDTRDTSMVSLDGRSTHVVAYFKQRSDRQLEDAAQRIQDGFAGQRDVLLGGEQIADTQANTQVGNDLARAELLAFPFIFLLSLLFFRSLVAALLPPLIGGVAIVATFFALRIVTGFADLSVFALNFVTGLGLGLAIDYSLFMVSRYREEAATSGFGVETLRRTLETAGRTILFSSLTVAAAVASLAIFPQRFLYSMGVAGAVVALVAATLALVALPALLTVLGPRVNALAPTWLQRAADRDARPAQSGAWYRLSRFVMRRPGRVAVLSAAFLIALGSPLAGIRFVNVTASVLPHSASARQVDDTLGRDFPPNRTSPVEVVVGAPANSPQVRAVAAQIIRLPNVSGVATAQPAGANNALLAVASVQRPLSGRSKQLVRDIRAIRAPVYIGVAGQTAAFLDLEHSLGAHLPAVLAVIVAATLIVLFVFTGSVVLPLKAVLMNLLNLSAVLGILVLIFQDGRLERLLSYTSQWALDATQPIFLAAVAFGLATDYGVFLLSRIKEARDSGVSDSEACRRRARAHGTHRHGRSDPVCGRDRSIRDVEARVHQGTRARNGAHSADRRLDHPRPACAVAHGTVRPWNWWAPKPLRRLHDWIGLRESGPPATPTPDPARA
jgi:RND superfamily putative drug exporter